MFTPIKKRRKKKISKACLHLPPMILVLFLDLDWIFVNLPVKSLGSNMSKESEAIRSRTIPSWPWHWFSWSCSWPWLREWPSQWSEAMLSAVRLVVLPTSSRDMSPLSSHCPLVKTWPSTKLARRHYMMVNKNQKHHWQRKKILFQKSNTLGEKEI